MNYKFKQYKNTTAYWIPDELKQSLILNEYRHFYMQTEIRCFLGLQLEEAFL